MRYLVKHKLRFTNAAGLTQICEVGDVVSFEDGDDVNPEFLLKVGAIEEYKPKKAKQGEDKWQ